MSTRGIADIVFCLDASDSMRPCINGVRKHLADFVNGLNSSRQMKWDMRLDFVAHSAGETQGGASAVFDLRSLYNKGLVAALYARGQQHTGRFFTSNTAEFCGALDGIEVGGNEASLVALDCCLDFPWRDAAACHRVVIFMTDEPFETGVFTRPQQAKLIDLQQKIQQLKVMLYMVAPKSRVYDELSAVDRSEYEVVGEQGTGLASVNFREVLMYIGKSVSVSTLQGKPAEPVERGLFGQAGWPETDDAIRGR